MGNFLILNTLGAMTRTILLEFSKYRIHFIDVGSGQSVLIFTNKIKLKQIF